jgi:hypothetical protein
MISIERNRNGSYSLTALVRDEGETPFSWYETMTYYQYPKKELKKLFMEHLAENKLTLQKEED